MLVSKHPFGRASRGSSTWSSLWCTATSPSAPLASPGGDHRHGVQLHHAPLPHTPPSERVVLGNRYAHSIPSLVCSLNALEPSIAPSELGGSVHGCRHKRTGKNSDSKYQESLPSAESCAIDSSIRSLNVVANVGGGCHWHRARAMPCAVLSIVAVTCPRSPRRAAMMSPNEAVRDDPVATASTDAALGHSVACGWFL